LNGSACQELQSAFTEGAFTADLSANLSLTAGTVMEVTGWRTTGVNSLFNAGGFNSSTGRFTARITGYYAVFANIRIDGVSTGNSLMIIAVDGSIDGSNGLAAIDSSSTSYHTMNIAGTVYLLAGQYVSVFANAGSDTSWTVQGESGFSVHYIDMNPPVPPSPTPSPAPSPSTSASQTTVEGSFAITVSNTSAILSNAAAKTAFESAMATEIANSAGNGITAANVDVTVSASGSSRRLQSGGLRVAYTITIPADSSSSSSQVVTTLTNKTPAELQTLVTSAVSTAQGTVPALSSLTVTGAEHGTLPKVKETPGDGRLDGATMHGPCFSFTLSMAVMIASRCSRN
jgi:hypothetical protein